MILITGAGGKTGTTVIKTLVTRGAPVRAFVRSAAHQASLTAMGVKEIVVGAMDDPRSSRKRYEGRMRSITSVPTSIRTKWLSQGS